MTLSLAVELAMVMAAFILGALAIRRARKERRSVLDLLGLRWSGVALRDLVAGMAITALAMGGIFLVELGAGAIVAAPAAPTSLPGLGVLAAGKLAATFKEELIMRSLLLTGLLLVLRGRAWLAIGLSAIAFGLIHLSNPGASALSVTGNALGGVIYGMAFVMAGNLWLPIGLHFAWNFVQGPMLGFPVSGLAAGGLLQVRDLGPAWLTGGSYGPEAGLVGIGFRLVVIALMLMWLSTRWRKGAAPHAAPGVAQPARP